MNRAALSSIAAVTSLTVLLLAGCGGGDDGNDDESSASSSAAPTATEPADQPEPTAADDANPAGAADCSLISPEELGMYALSTQLLAQVSTADQVATLREGTLGSYSPDAFGAVLTDLRTILAGQSDSMFGDSNEALDNWEQANTQMAEMIAAPDPTPQEMLDAYVALGDVGTKLGWQLPINAPLSEMCPELGNV